MYRAVNLTSKSNLENMRIKHILPQPGDLISPVLVRPGVYLNAHWWQVVSYLLFYPSGRSQNERKSRKSAVKDWSMGGRPLRTLQPQIETTKRMHAVTCPLHDRAPILVSHSLCDPLRAEQHVPGREFEVQTYPRKYENKTYPFPSWRSNLSCFGMDRGISERPSEASGVILPVLSERPVPK